MKQIHHKMDNKLNTNKVLYNKLNDYFKDNIKLSNICYWNLFIITKEDVFYYIDIYNENIPSFIINNDNSVIDSMIIKDLCYKQIIDINISVCVFSRYCFARNAEKSFYCLDFKNKNVKKYISDENIIDMSCTAKQTIFLTQSGKVYEFDYRQEENNIKDLNFINKSFSSEESKNERIVMISCGEWHSLALTESGRVFGWGYNGSGQLGLQIKHSNKTIIIEMNDLKIKKICCGFNHSLLLSCDGDIYAFGSNRCGQVGNGTQINQKFPIKLELNNKFIDIASHPYYHISMSKSIDGIYYVWGKCKDSNVLRPQSTQFESFDEILNYNQIDNNKKIGRLIEFEDSFVRNSYYNKRFEEIKELGFGSFGTVFKAKDRDINDFYAIKKIRFNIENKSDIIREYLNYQIISKDYSENENLVKHFNAWFEEYVNPNESEICLYIQMELCDKTIEDVVNELTDDSIFKTTESLTTIGYYIASQIFIEILEGVNYLHKQNPPLIHRDLKPANILLKKSYSKGICVKIADFGLIAIHDFPEKSHTLDKGSNKFMAPEVINSTKYNTKADVYSLGIIFQDLFDLKLIE
jgi:hypothetical protein